MAFPHYGFLGEFSVPKAGGRLCCIQNICIQPLHYCESSCDFSSCLILPKFSHKCHIWMVSHHNEFLGVLISRENDWIFFHIFHICMASLPCGFLDVSSKVASVQSSFHIAHTKCLLTCVCFNMLSQIRAVMETFPTLNNRSQSLDNRSQSLG